MLNYEDSFSESFRAVSVAMIAVSFCFLVTMFPVSGWTLAMMTVVSLVGISGILGVKKSDNGQKREG